jgi:hypothetical protein
MKKEKLTENFDNAVISLLDLTRRLCYNELSSNYRFLLKPNDKSTDNHLDESEVTFHKNLLNYENKLLDKKDVLEQIWTDNKVPLWINISVTESTDSLTTIELLTSRRLRSETELNHKADKFPPFHIAIPLPPGQNDGQKFDVNWRKQQKNKKRLWAKIKELVN